MSYLSTPPGGGGGGTGTPGGATFSLQYNAGAGNFGGIAGASTDGTATTFTSGNLLVADVKASAAGGLLLKSNTGTDIGLFGSGSGASALFYGDVTLNTMTSGSVLFAGASGLVSQDNARFFWDSTNYRLGIRTNAPKGLLHISVGTSGLGSIVNGRGAIITTNSTGHNRVYFENLAGTTGQRVFAINNEAGIFHIGSLTDDANSWVNQYPLAVTYDGKVGFLTGTPTHTITMGATGTGATFYNTTDQTTNYERLVLKYNSGSAGLYLESGGTGSINRPFTISGGGGSVTLSDAAHPSGTWRFDRTTGTGNTGGFGVVNVTGTWTQSANTFVGVSIRPTINQTLTAGYTGLLINATETALGSGNKRFVDLQIGGTTKFSIDNNGDFDWVTGSQYLRHGGTPYIGLNAATGKLEFVSGLSTANGSVIYSNPTGTSTSLNQKFFHLNPTVNQTSGTGGYTGYFLNVVETAVGSGSKYLMDLQVGGVSKFSVDNTGKIVSAVNTIQLSSAAIARGGAHTLTLTTSGTTNATYPSGTITLADTTSTQTFTAKRITNRVQSVASSATVTPSWDNDDAVIITAQAAGLTLANPTGTPTSTQKMVIRIKDNGTARSITYGTQYRAIGLTLPTTTVINKTIYMGGFWNVEDGKIDIVAYALEA